MFIHPDILIASGVILIFVFLIYCYYLFFYLRVSGISLKDKHFVITGGSSGIGKSLACEAAKRGANVTIIARNKERLIAAREEILNLCINSDQKVEILSLDVSGNYDEIETEFNKLEVETGPVYCLINCAGGAICGILEDTSASEIKRVHELNFLGSVYPTKAVVEGMKARGYGHITFVSSQAAFLGIYGFAPYSASKYALRGLAEGLNMEVSVYGVKVTISFPPDTDTPGFAEEEKTKPKETKLICSTSGLVSPDAVANKILNDTLAGIFMSSIGFDGFLLSTLHAGMTPYYSCLDLLIQICLMGYFRLIGIMYYFSFQKIINKCHLERNQSKRSE